MHVLADGPPDVQREHIHRLFVEALHHVLAADTQQGPPPRVQLRASAREEGRVGLVGGGGAHEAGQGDLLGDVTLEANTVRPIQARMFQTQQQALANEDSAILLPVGQDGDAHARTRARHHHAAGFRSLARQEFEARVRLPQGQAGGSPQQCQVTASAIDGRPADDVSALLHNDVGTRVAVCPLEAGAGVADRKPADLCVAHEIGTLLGEVLLHLLHCHDRSLPSCRGPPGLRPRLCHGLGPGGGGGVGGVSRLQARGGMAAHGEAHRDGGRARVY
mmetsp:Transcript_67357/g.219415  ORF Transcript_67357/g.219415 Transcript_67357/m.219415 type:complete len:276 (+) Transcript_67357:1239-2066(+)